MGGGINISDIGRGYQYFGHWEGVSILRTLGGDINISDIGRGYRYFGHWEGVSIFRALGGGINISGVLLYLCSDFITESTGTPVNGQVAIGLDRGWVIVARVSDLSTEAFDTKQTVRAFLMDGNKMLFSTAKETLVWWTMDGRQEREVGGAPGEQALKVAWGKERDTIWLSGPSLLSLVQLDRESGSCKLIGQIEGYQITCVGLSHNLGGGALVAGDITGKVAVLGEDTTPTHQCQLSNSVRCILWTRESGILIGCLDGSIYRWDDVSWEPPERFCHLQGSVLHLRLNQSADSLAVGNSVGQLGVFNLGISKVSSALKIEYL